MLDYPYFTDKKLRKSKIKSLLQGCTRGNRETKIRTQRLGPSTSRQINKPPAGLVGKRLAYGMIHPKCILFLDLEAALRGLGRPLQTSAL